MAKKKKANRPVPADAQPAAGHMSGLAGSINKKCDDAARLIAPYKILLEIIAVVLIIAAGFFFRMEDLADWRKVDPRAFYEGQPLHTTFDAYFYLSLAKDLIDGTYNPIDEKRGVPDCPPRPSPPPLISVLAAGIVKATSWSLSWVGAVLPAILGSLLALPLYFFGRRYSGFIAGATAGILSLLYPFYIFRSGLGRFDTDCLNVTFILLSACLFMQFAFTASWRRYLYVALALLNYGLFLWWWDQTPAVVTAITFPPFAVALIFYYRPSRREALIFGSVILCGLLSVLAVKGPAVVTDMIKAIFMQFLYISKDAMGDFPNIGVTISEQSRPPLSTIVMYTSGSYLSFLFGCAGIALLLYKRFRESLFLASILVLSFLAFTYANRFIIFLVPLLALGAGFLIGELVKLRKRFMPALIICPLLLLYFIVPLYIDNRENVQWPKINGPTTAGLDAALHKTPPDSVIWSWWDNGYAITYFARRATVNDGSIHSGERTYYNALPLAFTDFRLSANFMHFYVIRGMLGIAEFNSAAGGSRQYAFELMKKILATGPAGARPLIDEAGLTPTVNYKSTDDWLAFFFPPQKRPVYLFLDTLLTRIVYWWYWFGTWDFEKRDGVHLVFDPYYGIKMQGDVITGSDGLHFDVNTGILKSKEQEIPVSRLAVRTQSQLKERKYPNESRYCFELSEPRGYGAVMDNAVAETVFNKLFIRMSYDTQYFQPVTLNGMIFQLWEVKGDSFEPGRPP